MSRLEDIMSIANRTALALLLVLAGTSLAAAQFNCGDTIDAGQSVVLTDDIDGCTAATNPALTITGPAKVDMAGFSLLCTGFDPNDPNSPVGIRLEGKGVKLSNGGVFGCGRGLELASDGSHKVENFAAEDAETHGIVVESDKNKLENITSNENDRRGVLVQGNKNKLKNIGAASNDGDGFHVNGDDNRAQRVVVSENAADGVELDGSGNKVKDCFSSGNAAEGVGIDGDENKVEKCIVTRHDDDDPDPNDPGIEITGDRNQVKNNLVNDNASVGIAARAGADDNKITKNVAIGNPDDDLRDDTVDCGSNQWKSNTFGTSSADGVPNHGCIE